MGWQMLLLLLLLLLLHLHLVQCASLPAPTNVSISSFNLEHTLVFLPGPETPSSARYTVEILRLRRKKISWKPVAGCLELTAGQTCNLTRAFSEPLDQYRARVQAFTPNQTSTWAMSEQFQPLSDTWLGPPDMSASGCGNCLLLQLRVPTTVQLLKYLYTDLVFNVQRTRDGAQFSLNLQYEEEIMITYLEPGVEYCVTVSVKTVINSNTVPSKPHCAFTSPPAPTSSLYMVYGLLGAFSALGFLLFGLLFFGSRLNFKLLRRRLTRTLSHTNHGSAPPERQGQIPATRLHKDGSADCLLTAHWPVQVLRSSSVVGEEDCGLNVK